MLFVPTNNQIKVMIAEINGGLSASACASIIKSVDDDSGNVIE